MMKKKSSKLDLEINSNVNKLNNNINLNKINIFPENLQKEQKKANYENNGILLIFNKLSIEYNFNIKEKIKQEKTIEEEKAQKNEQNNIEIKEETKEEEKKEEPNEAKIEEIKKEEVKNEIKEEKNNFINEECLYYLEKELENTTFNELLKAQAPYNVFYSIIKDYYFYFVTRDKSLTREINDLDNLCKLLEMICEFQFEFNINKMYNLSKKDFLLLIIWTNNYFSDINELLSCVDYIKKENIFKKKKYLSRNIK